MLPCRKDKKVMIQLSIRISVEISIDGGLVYVRAFADIRG